METCVLMEAKPNPASRIEEPRPPNSRKATLLGENQPSPHGQESVCEGPRPGRPLLVECASPAARGNLSDT